jgi:NADH dehydrogenase [ubiquinone] 1 alpha subcomplex assembly factor 5
MSGFAALAAARREARRRGATALLGRVTSPSARALSCSGAARDASDASSFVDVEKAQERARLKAAALAAQSAAESGAMHVFDRAVKAAHRDRAAYLRRHDPSGDRTDPFLEEITKRTLDRLNDVKRAFENVLVLGGATDAVLRRLLEDRPDVRVVVVVDASRDMLAFVRENAQRDFGADRLASRESETRTTSKSSSVDVFEDADIASHTLRNANGDAVRVHYAQFDEENLPARDGAFDVVVSALGLHWANDLPGAMAAARASLKPDGLFLSSILGGETLREMRIACAVAEMETEGGVSQRVSPLAQVRDCGNLLTRAGMKLPAVDVDTLTVQYPSPAKLVEHLRSMAETNAAVSRRPGAVRRTTAAAAAACYQHMFPAADAERGDAVECTFQVLYMTGWSPGTNQPEPLERGSAELSLAKLEEELAKVPPGKGPRTES